MLKETLVALSVATLATTAVALPLATAKAAHTSVQLAQSDPCNPCAAACNPCAAACNPCVEPIAVSVGACAPRRDRSGNGLGRLIGYVVLLPRFAALQIVSISS